jgi:RNase P/RNase MRP subunit POP5
MITKYKNRYLLIESSEATSPMKNALQISNAIKKEIGEIGYSIASPKIMLQFNESVFIMRVNRGHEGDIILALSFIKKLDGKSIGLYSIKVSGTIRKLLDFCSNAYKTA